MQIQLRKEKIKHSENLFLTHFSGRDAKIQASWENKSFNPNESDIVEIKYMPIYIAIFRTNYSRDERI